MPVTQIRKENSRFHSRPLNVSSTTFPDGLIEETLRTLALLFPQSDPATNDWYRRWSV
jgi:hypothetical protein